MEMAKAITASASSVIDGMNNALLQESGGSRDGEEITPAKAVLQSVIDGALDASDLMDLLDEIDASAKTLIDSGKGDEHDELIGKAAEKWAELDQQANG
jgi:hypothetical protein